MAAKIFCPASEIMKSRNSFPALGCGAPREIEADLRLPFLDTLVAEKLSFELGDIRNTMVIGTDLDGGIWGSLKTYLCWFDLADLTELEAALEQALDERICAFKLRAEW